MTFKLIFQPLQVVDIGRMSSVMSDQIDLPTQPLQVVDIGRMS